MTGETDIVERLENAALAAEAESWRRTDAHSLGIGANLAREAADLIERQAAEIARLRAGGCARDQTTTQFCAEAAMLAKRVAELEAEVAAFRDPWKPISEAPRDGTLVLFMTRNGMQHIAPSVPDPNADLLRDLNRQVYERTGEWPQAGWLNEWWMHLPAGPIPPAGGKED